MAEGEIKKGWYDKYYKILFLIPVLMLLLSAFYIYSFNSETGDIMKKDVTLTGGTTITVFTDAIIDAKDIENSMSSKFGDVVVRVLTDLRTGKQIAFSIETRADVEDLKTELEDYLHYSLKEDDYTAEFTGSALSESFYKELMTAMALALFLMAVVVFFFFRVPIPSLAVVFAALTDIVVTLAVVNILGIRVSTAGIAAFLMLIGYSVDTDILLTNRVLKRKEEPLNQRMFGAFKTGMTMTLTSFTAVFAAYFIAISSVLKQVFIILSIGLLVDMVVTWLGNTALLKWYCNKKGII